MYFSSNSHGVATNPLNFNTEEIARKCTFKAILMTILTLHVCSTTISNSKVIVV